MHSRPEILSLESLDMSRAVGSKSLEMSSFDLESLEMPKICRESLGMSFGPRPGLFQNNPMILLSPMIFYLFYVEKKL